MHCLLIGRCYARRIFSVKGLYTPSNIQISHFLTQYPHVPKRFISNHSVSDHIRLPDDYVAETNENEINPEISSNWTADLHYLPLWARRKKPPVFDRLAFSYVTSVPLVILGAATHLLPILGYPDLARDALSALITTSAMSLCFNSAVHGGLQKVEFGFPDHRSHRGLYSICRTGIAYYCLANSLMICGLVFDAPLDALYLSMGCNIGLTAVDWLLWRKRVTPLWYFKCCYIRCLWTLLALLLGVLSEQQRVVVFPARMNFG